MIQKTASSSEQTANEKENAMSIPRGELNPKAKQVVANELRRLNLHVEIARRDNTKQEDLLVNTNGGKGVLIAVRSKQKADWPPIKDVLGSCEFIVFVDFEKKSVNQRPDCYVLSREDWQDVVKRRLADLRHDYPGIQIDTTNPHEPVFPDQITQRGAEMRGITVKLRYLQPYKEHWGKIINFLAASTALIVPAAAAPTSSEGLLRTEGALADDPLWDTIMEKVHRERKTDTRPEVLE